MFVLNQNSALYVISISSKVIRTFQNNLWFGIFFHKKTVQGKMQQLL